MAASTHNQKHKNDDYKHETVVHRKPSYDEDVVNQLEVFGCGTRAECINASYNCVDYKNINEVMQCVEEDIIPPPPPLYRNRRHIHAIYIDIAPPMEEYPTPNIIRQKWSSEESPSPSPTSASDVHMHIDEKRDIFADTLEKTTSDSKSKLLPITLEIPPFLKLMESLSHENYQDDDDKQSEVVADRVQLYAVIRDITDMSNHNDVAKKVLLLTHHLVTNSHMILKCLEQRVFRDDHDSDCRMSTTSNTSNGSEHTSSSITATTTSHNSFPSFHSFSNLTELALSSTLRDRSNECILPNGSILSSFFIQAKVLEFIRYWMTEYWEEDWQANAELRACCKSFIRRYKEHEKVNVTQNEIAKSIILIDLLEKTLKNCQKRAQSQKLSSLLGDEIDFNNVILPSALPTLMLSNKSSSSYTSVRGGSKHREIPQDVIDIDSKLIAQQITLRQHKLYSKIHPRECLNQAWKCSKNKYILAPNISKYIDQFNVITKWIQYTILSAKNVKHRGLTIKRWIKTEEYLYQMNNLMGVSAIRCALNSTAIFKLKDAWFFVERKHQKHMKQHKEIAKFYDRSNWKQLRQFENNCLGALIPYFVMFATDMIAIETINKKRVKNGTINFKGLCVINDRINSHLKHQNKQYKDIKLDATIQRWMNHEMSEANKLSDEELYSKSKMMINKDKKELGNKSRI